MVCKHKAGSRKGQADQSSHRRNKFHQTMAMSGCFAVLEQLPSLAGGCCLRKFEKDPISNMKTICPSSLFCYCPFFVWNVSTEEEGLFAARHSRRAAAAAVWFHKHKGRPRPRPAWCVLDINYTLTLSLADILLAASADGREDLCLL